MKTSSATSRIQANLQELFQASLSPGDAYIRFTITSDITALLSMRQVQESLVIDSNKITPLPNMPKSLIGIMSSRNHVFCVFDLAQLMAFPSPLESPRKYQVIVLETTGEQPIYIGLAVNSLQGMMRLPEETIQLFSEVNDPKAMPYVYGEAEQAKTRIPILEFNEIVEALKKMGLAQ